MKHASKREETCHVLFALKRESVVVTDSWLIPLGMQLCAGGSEESEQ